MPRKKKDPEAEDMKARGFYESEVSTLPDEEPENVKYADDGSRVEFQEGSITVDLSGEDAEAAEEGTETDSAEFDANLADKLAESEKTGLGLKLYEYVQIDIESRQPWESRMIDGMQIIGLDDIPEDAVAFEGAARVTHPGIAEAMVQFNARAMEELMPPEGPVKCGVIGESNEALEAQAERVEDYMNYQLTEEDDEYHTETDDMLFALPYFGSAFKKVAVDPQTGRTRSRYVPATDFIVPYWAKSLKTASRYTHRYTMPINGFKRAVASGYFIDCDFQPQQPMTGDQTGQRLADKSDDRTETYHEDDQILTLYEMHIEYEFDWETYGPKGDDNKPTYKLPYAITFEEQTGRVVRIARLWDEDDEKCQKQVWFIHYKFLPGFGFYGFGYLHLIGGLGRAASGALRLLLDGSATSSMLGGFKSRDAHIASEVVFTPATWQDVDMTAEELAKSFYTPPFKEPSPALFKTLEILVDGMQRFASTTEAQVGDAPTNGPVGTTVAIIEQGSKIFSGIHKRLHNAARQEFRMIAYSNYRFMETDEYPFEVAGGDRSVMREDFGPAIDIAPVSDPNIFSSVQRIALAQALKQMVDEDKKGLFSRKDSVRAYRQMLKALRVPDWDTYLKESDVKRMDPVSENESLLHGSAVQTFMEQDDASHLTIHQNFKQEVMGMEPEIQEQVLPALMAHIAAHYAQAMRKRISQQLEQASGIPLPPYDMNDPENNEELPPEMENQIAMMVAQIVPPPPAPVAQPDPEQAKDEAASRQADREDMLAQRRADRDDAVKAAELKRDGIVSDVEPGAPAQ